MSRSQEDDWIDEVQHNEGFVVDETKSGLEIPNRQVTYRRAIVGAQFMTSHFDSQTEDLFEAHSSKNVKFSTNSATLQDLEYKLPSVGSMQTKSEHFDHNSVKVAGKSRILMPTEEVPDASEVGYHQVNPMFESCAPADVIYHSLHEAMRALDIETSCSPDWTMDGYALIEAEELYFSVHLHRLAIKSTIRVDFNLRSGDELKFLGLTDLIRQRCRAIDKDMISLPELSFDIMADWSSPEKLVSKSHVEDSQELSMLLLDLNSETSPSTRYQVAKRLKEFCKHDLNRRALVNLLKEQFVIGLQSMLQDVDEDIVRFAIFTILSFADDVSSPNDLELPHLPETLRGILTISQKDSTKKLAGDLYKTICAVC
ncbi:Armadillo-type fold [Plasmopara halstedii]|uniref:Armadillo-type fold n=1 Tax=Plasmopara halstedii TaxID=4781 RepID=A0A0P1A527_PLAHL|nr:Armadillo-type fold [Plasmopara halstedii]CEG35636.1 Armadillo-type fold [Plasmopara halstedii]|eukprot:XP_024572005.1 Armadillo-type fold [Plasmopara halstedii]